MNWLLSSCLLVWLALESHLAPDKYWLSSKAFLQFKNLLHGGTKVGWRMDKVWNCIRKSVLFWKSAGTISKLQGLTSGQGCQLDILRTSVAVAIISSTWKQVINWKSECTWRIIGEGSFKWAYGRSILVFRSLEVSPSFEFTYSTRIGFVCYVSFIRSDICVASCVIVVVLHVTSKPW